MKKLLLITDSWTPLINGVVTTLTKMVELAKLDGWEVTVIEPSRYKSIPCPGYPEIPLTLSLRTAWRDLDAAGATHVHISTEGPLGLLGKAWCKKRGHAFTTSYHTNFAAYLKQMFKLPEALTWFFLKRFHKSSSVILTPSATTTRKLKSIGLSQAATWGRGCNLDIFNPHARVDVFPHGTTNLLYVGRVVHAKNLNAFYQLARDPRYTLHVVGDGPDLSEMRQEWGHKVHFWGAHRDRRLAMFFASADCFVFPSLTDTLGVVMLEAIACGVPVAAYPVEGPIDVVLEGVTGSLNDSLVKAVETAVKLPRADVAKVGATLSWEASYQTFSSALVPIA